jgi:hypothetical protein
MAGTIVKVAGVNHEARLSIKQGFYSDIAVEPVQPDHAS